MKRIVKRFLSAILAAILIVIPTFSVSANEYERYENGMIITKMSNTSEIVQLGDMTIEDVTMPGYRKIVTTYGNTVSEYYEDFSTNIATVSVNGTVMETYDMNEMRSNCEVWEIPENDIQLINKILSDYIPGEQVILPSELSGKYTVTYQNDGSTYIEPTENKNIARASTADIRPKGNVTSTYPEYTYKEVDSKTEYSSVCGRNIDMSIKDSMCNYTRTSQKKYYYVAGTVVSVIAGALKIASSTLISTLAGYTTIVGGILKLASNINYYFEESYSFYALRQGYVYDYTFNYADVSVLTEYGNGKISLTWDYINNEYKNPAWKITAIAYPHQISYSEMYSNTKEIWEANISEYGYWKWGNI